jgi:hypothetical protein
MDLARLLTPDVLALSIPIIAILSGTFMAVLRHRERMAMIEQGMDPDAVKKAKLLRDAAEEVPKLERR